jgi:hypothetical protein
MNYFALQGENKLNFDEMMIDNVRFVLDQHTYLDFYSASSLKQQTVDTHVAPLGNLYSDSQSSSL